MSPMDISPSSSSSSSSSSLHHASLVHPSLHSPALLDILLVKLTPPIIDYIVESVSETVDYAMGRPSSSTRSPSKQNLAFTTFVTNIITRAELTTPIILASLVYIDRAKPHLHIALEEWAHERVFLGAVITASKYLNDSTLKNVHWALCTGVFGKRDIGRIEREFLDVLDFQLGITEDDLLSHHSSLAAVAPSQHIHPLPTTLHHASAPHTQQQRHTLTVPPLDPSSPMSSLSGSSPSTPNSLSSTSPSVATSSESPSSEAIVDDHKSSRQKFNLASSTMDLIRSFPVPQHQRRHSRGVSTIQNDRHYRRLPMIPRVSA